MTLRNYRTFAVVASGDQVSGDIDLRGMRTIGLWGPTVDSCQAFLQVNHAPVDPVSADFVRLRERELGNAAQWTWPIGPGSEAIAISADIEPFHFARIDLDVAQTDNRSFAIIGKP